MGFYLNSAQNILLGGDVTANPTEYTISGWVKMGPSFSGQAVTTRSDSSGPGSSWSHQLLIGSSLRHYWYGSAGGQTLFGPAMSANIWYHVVISAKNGGLSKLYMNGVPGATPVTTGATLWTGGNRWYIFYGMNDYQFAHLSLWSVQLTDDEVLRLYNTSRLSPQSIQPQNLIFYFPMNDVNDGISNSSNSWYNVAGKSFTQTITGTITGRADHFLVG